MGQLSRVYQNSSILKGQVLKKPRSEPPPPDSSSKERPEEKTPCKAEQKTHIKGKEATGAFGLGILLGWMFLCNFSDTLSLSMDAEQIADAGIMRFVGITVFTLVFAGFLIQADYFATVSLRRLSLVALLTGLMLPACALMGEFGAGIPAFISWIAWGANGLAMACAFSLWANYYCALPRYIIVFSTVIVCLTAGCWYFFIGFLPLSIQAIGIYLSLLLSIVCLVIFVGESTASEFVSRKDSELILGLDMRTSVSLSVIGLASGYLLFKIVFEQPHDEMLIIGAAFFANALFTFILNKICGQYALLVAPVLRYGFPVVVIGFIILPFLQDFALVGCEVFLLAALIEHWVSSFVNISFAIEKYKIQAYYLWTRVNITFILGCAIGWGAALVMFGLVANSIVDATFSTLASSLAFVVIFVIASTIAPYGIDHLTVKRNFEAKAASSDDANSKRTWWEACYVTATKSHLTPRETEVFLLLAKGRSSKIIERELSISSHTVKSHNYNIYRKVGVYSQQELIDTVESLRLELKN